MLAARYGRGEIVRIFLERKDGPNAPGDNGKTDLHATVQWSQYGIINMLLKSGRVDGNRKDSQGRTALPCCQFGQCTVSQNVDGSHGYRYVGEG